MVWEDGAARPLLPDRRPLRPPLRQVAATAMTASPQSYLGEGWNTSVSKVLDHAIVGFAAQKDIMSRNKSNRSKKQAVFNLLKDAGLADPLDHAKRLKEFARTELPQHR